MVLSRLRNVREPALDPSFDGGDSLGKATDIGLDLPEKHEDRNQ